MRLGIIADTHDHLTHIKAFVDQFRQHRVDMVVHAGDVCSPFALEPFSALECPVRMVFGNNDGDWDLLRKRAEGIAEIRNRPWRLELDGKRVLLLHEPDFLREFTHSGDFDLIIYGHTHTPDTHVEKDTRVINPGEACGWLRGKATAIVYDLATDEIEWLGIP